MTQQWVGGFDSLTLRNEKLVNKELDKLEIVIRSGQTDECQVVYVLSRIRKLMELNKKIKKTYKELKFYCNWSLHAQIDHTEDVSDILKEFRDNADSRHHFLHFEVFRAELKKFTSEVLNIALTDDYLRNFTITLTEIIADTPISITESKKTTIVINPPELIRTPDQITYKIVPG